MNTYSKKKIKFNFSFCRNVPYRWRRFLIIGIILICWLHFLFGAYSPSTFRPNGYGWALKKQVLVIKKDPRQAKIVLFRTIGNDLPPLHETNHSLKIVQSILMKEQLPKSTERKWLLWHIYDESQLKNIVELLTRFNEQYYIEKFSLEDYANILPCERCVENFQMIHKLPDLNDISYIEFLNYFKYKKRYLWGQEIGTDIVKAMESYLPSSSTDDHDSYFLPLDLNSIFLLNDFQKISDTLERKIRNSQNSSLELAFILKQKNETFLESEIRLSEKPFFLFSTKSSISYNDKIFNEGRNLGAELLRTLGEKGWWSHQKLFHEKRARKAGSIQMDIFPKIGKIDEVVLEKLEEKKIMTSLMKLMTKINHVMMKELYSFDKAVLISFDERILLEEKHAYQEGQASEQMTSLIHKLHDMGDTGLHVGPFSVVDKLEKPPSGSKNDYYTPAPYYWPNPKTRNGLPYIVRDGFRVPGTLLYDSMSEKFDRTRFAAFVGNTTALGLSWFFTDNLQHGEKAALNFRTWFINKETRMNPHMTYSQIRWGHNNNIGQCGGIIETKDLYSLLDIAKLLRKGGILSEEDMVQLEIWVEKFLSWLLHSKNGNQERRSQNNHGLYYDIQASSLAAFIGDGHLFRLWMEKARLRLYTQFDTKGTMPHEMRRPTQLHYIMFSLQGAYILASMAERAGVDLWSYKKPEKINTLPILKKGAHFALPFCHEKWSHSQTNTEDIERMLPLYFVAQRAYNQTLQIKRNPNVNIYEIKPRFNEHDGIQLFWNFGRS